MHLSTDHPGYDFDMEVLAFIPPAPTCVPVQMISEDMSETNAKPVREAIERLKKNYYLKSLTFAHQHCVQASASRFETIQRDATRYLNMIYF